MSAPPFQVFLDRFRTDVYRFLAAAVGPIEADDCFQETFLAALRAYPRLNREPDLKAWVLTIAHRKAVDSHRARARRPTPVEEVPERPAPAAPAIGDADTALWSAVDALPGKQRLAVIHRFTNDLAYRQIGAVMGTTEEAARRNVHEGLKKLRKEWVK